MSHQLQEAAAQKRAKVDLVKAARAATQIAMKNVQTMRKAEAHHVRMESGQVC